MLSSPSSSECQQISNFIIYTHGYLKISDSSMFMVGYDSSQLHLYKHTFGSNSPNWSLKLAWPSGTWTIGSSESFLISSAIYTFFLYGSSLYAYMAVISVSDGTVINRYKSSVSWLYVYGSGVKGDYIVVSFKWSSSYLLIFNRVTSSFNIRSFSGTILWGIGLDTYGR